MISSFKPLVLVLLTFSVSFSLENDNVEITILHTNDVHSRFAQTNRHSGACSAEEEEQNECFAGFARLHRKVSEIRATHDNVLYLSAGDYYQGTVWYTLHKWRIVSELVNILNHTALALGNHEFDDNIAGLLPFIDSATFPIVAANIDATLEPDFLARQKIGSITKSIVVTASNGAKIGIIGFTTEETPTISYPGNLTFLNVVESVDKEAKRLYNDGVKILIALGHGGFDVEQEVAAGVELIDVVVGGHTNTFLYNGTAPSDENPVGNYPFLVEQRSGRKVPCVQAYAFGKYLGYLNVTFDKEGEVVGAFGNPILLDSSIDQDEALLERIIELGKNVSELAKIEVGTTHVFLNGKTDVCRMRECNLGNVIADSMVFINRKYPEDRDMTGVNLAIMNSGGIRGSIDNMAKNGSVSMEDILQVLPFDNTIDMIEIKGEHLLEAFQYSIEGYDPNGFHPAGKFLQVSGFKVAYDINNLSEPHVDSIQVLCQSCDNPIYEPLNLTEVYKIILPTFIATGGDGFVVLRDKAISYDRTGISDADMLVEYFKNRSPVTQNLENRVRFVNPEEDNSNQATGNNSSGISHSYGAGFLLIIVLLTLV